MALSFNQLGFLIEPSAAQGDSATANSYTADMRDQLTNPEDGMICFDPDTKGILFWNGAAWLPVMASTVTRSVANISGNYTMPNDVDIVVANASAGPVTVTLPMVTANKGREIALVKSDSSANAVTAVSQDTDKIGDGADTAFALTSQHAMLKLLSADSGIWYCV